VNFNKLEFLNFADGSNKAFSPFSWETTFDVHLRHRVRFI